VIVRQDGISVDALHGSALQPVPDAVLAQNLPDQNKIICPYLIGGLHADLSPVMLVDGEVMLAPEVFRVIRRSDFLLRHHL
jgi:hypothetical protein